MKNKLFLLGACLALVLYMMPFAGNAQEDPSYECDDRFGMCGTPEQSGGGGGGGGGSILVNNTDLGDTYQNADDYDDDGVEDPYDNCPRVANPAQGDSDGDEVGDACDNCLDIPNADQSDLDGDRIGDVCDSDRDGDDIANDDDNCPDMPNPPVGDDGVQPDLDGDGEGDACDSNIDGDAMDNLEDPCPMNASIGEPTADQLAECFPDSDGDGVSEVDPLNPDVCPTIYDPEQLDTDADGLGDACDPDIDNDGVQNPYDNCPTIENADQEDIDRDGVGDECDDGFCYVVLGDEDNCLDPEASLAVYSPDLMMNTGDTVNLRFFSNRINQAMNYNWSITDAPAASGVGILKPTGIVTMSTPFEYHYLKNEAPEFTPDAPGTFKVKVVAETVWEDRVSGEVNETVSYTFAIKVEGASIEGDGDDDGGCAVIPVRGSNSGTPAIALLIMGLLLFLRRRK